MSYPSGVTSPSPTLNDRVRAARTATGAGEAVLAALILFTLFYNGLAGMSWQLFTQNTPPPGASEGGLVNAIVGSVIMTVIGVGVGAPIGLFAGT